MRNITDQTNNKVELQLPDYLDLYEFKKNIEEKGLVMTKVFNSHYYSQTTFVSLDNAWEQIKSINEAAVKTNNELQNEVLRLKLENDRLSLSLDQKLKASPEKNILTINDVKKFSIWQFIKWRKMK
jgi:DNA-binding transcriptional regulator/RsmH inhibitor MraZ